MFYSDNIMAAAPEIITSITQGCTGIRKTYGDDASTADVKAILSEIFERELHIFLVPTGTAANALGLSLLTPPYGAIICRCDSHLLVDECGAIEFATGGARLTPTIGTNSKIAPKNIEDMVKERDDVHAMPYTAVSVAQASECGLVYSEQELSEIGAVARQLKLKFHMDGARFANALAASGSTPANMTWRAGVDVLSFGATKNGCLMAEAVILFDSSLAEEAAYRCKRAGYLASKGCFFSSQWLTYLQDGLWLKFAEHANQQARKLSDEIVARKYGRLAWPTEANETFVIMKQALLDALSKRGVELGVWPASYLPPGFGLKPGENLVRLVTHPATTCAEIDRLMDLIAAAGASMSSPHLFIHDE